MKKYKFFTNLDKEEKWLNDMASQGYRFKKKTIFGYEFELGNIENEIIKMDYRTFKKREDFEDYCALFEDSNWEHIAGTKGSGYQYFRKVGEQGSAEIFSDVNSKAGRYKRLSDMWGMLACSLIPILVALIKTGSINPNVFLNPKLLYYTPGLWELNGVAFWVSFLLETPIALVRGISWLIIPIMILIYLYFAFKANKQYKKTQQNQMSYK